MIKVLVFLLVLAVSILSASEQSSSSLPLEKIKNPNIEDGYEVSINLQKENILTIKKHLGFSDDALNKVLKYMTDDLKLVIGKNFDFVYVNGLKLASINDGQGKNLTRMLKIKPIKKFKKSRLILIEVMFKFLNKEAVIEISALYNGEKITTNKTIELNIELVK